MESQLIYNFKKDISKISVPERLNNPFASSIPEIAHIAAIEFQSYIFSVCQKWKYDFRVRNGKMFGILVIQKEDTNFGFLGAVSGAIDRDVVEPHFVPPVFDSATEDFFINKGMTELTEIGNMIKQTNDQAEIITLKERRSKKSIELQRRLFEHTQFFNIHGKEKNVLQIFGDSSHGKPPSAAGECAAPKLLNYALKHQLRPIAIAEFWWGNPLKSEERKHKDFYPACKNKCRPILEYMLDDMDLFNQVKKHKNSMPN